MAPALTAAVPMTAPVRAVAPAALITPVANLTSVVRTPVTTSVPSSAAVVDSGRVVAIDESRLRIPPPLVSADTSNAHEVHGAIHAKYLALGAETSILGYPTTDETGTPDGIGRYNHFQAGSIYWTPNTGAYEVHGLIREFWAANGWERNPNLGYPISDELIPDRRIGHRRPETRRKPILNLPADVVKLPAEALGLGFAPTVVNTPLRVSAVATGVTAAAITPSTAAISVAPSTAASAVTASRLTPLPSEVVLNPGLPTLVGPASTPAPELSRNRFEDFESGVVFWVRGETAAKQLAPWTSAADGTNMHLSANDVLAAAAPQVQAAIAHLSGASFAGSAFAGTTSYWFDGLAAHNRRHRILFTLMGTHTQSGIFSFPMPISVIFEVQVEVSFEPEERSVRAFFTDWVPTSIPPDLTADPPLFRQLHAALDPLLWTSLDLLQIEDTNAGAPIAVLSVKTMPNGDVNIYIEP